MTDHDLAFTPAWRLRELIVSREISPVELTGLFLDPYRGAEPWDQRLPYRRC